MKAALDQCWALAVHGTSISPIWKVPFHFIICIPWNLKGTMVPWNFHGIMT
jgi:hypothetical protein